MPITLFTTAHDRRHHWLQAPLTGKALPVSEMSGLVEAPPVVPRIAFEVVVVFCEAIRTVQLTVTQFERVTPEQPAIDHSGRSEDLWVHDLVHDHFPVLFGSDLGQQKVRRFAEGSGANELGVRAAWVCMARVLNVVNMMDVGHV